MCDDANSMDSGSKVKFTKNTGEKEKKRGYTGPTGDQDLTTKRRRERKRI